jgi:hypothetical protein
MKVLHIKFHEHASKVKGTDTCGHKGNQTDITKLIGASRDGTNALEIVNKQKNYSMRIV